MLPRQKILAYIARMQEKGGLDRRRGMLLVILEARLIQDTFMVLHPISWRCIRDTASFSSYWYTIHASVFRSKKDRWNYFYRGLCAFAWAAMASGNETMCINVSRYCGQFAKVSGKEYFTEPRLLFHKINLIDFFRTNSKNAASNLYPDRVSSFP